MITFLQQLINGISQGSAYALIALGYTMVYGVLRLINFAHGDVYMFGAFMGYYMANAQWVQNRLGNTPLAAILIMIGAMVLSSIIGILIERFAYRPGRGQTSYALGFWLGVLGACSGAILNHSVIAMVLGAAIGITVGVVLEKYGLSPIVVLIGKLTGRSFDPERYKLKPIKQSSRLALLIIAIGVSLFMENEGQVVFGADPKFFPQIINTTLLEIGPLRIDSVRIMVLVVSIALMILLNVIVNYTKTGKAMRATSFSLDTAKLMGINTNRIIAITFALGSALAAAGGILVSTLYPKIDPLMGIMPGLKAFVAAVLGGIGNITGAMIGGLIVGMAEVMAVGYGQSTYRDAIAFIILVMILLLKPAGIMGKGLVEKV
jgi:branched-chain amino acid transport system permease protein